mmetsp:Transcript_144119/g.460728  ORF Transcript_144119/g.460728 Transcript_144119/m.460728 type:complete len:107 (+) Transcript_144119:1214-1534(+)
MRCASSSKKSPQTTTSVTCRGTALRILFQLLYSTRRAMLLHLRVSCSRPTICFGWSLQFIFAHVFSIATASQMKFAFVPSDMQSISVVATCSFDDHSDELWQEEVD